LGPSEFVPPEEPPINRPGTKRRSNAHKPDNFTAICEPTVLRTQEPRLLTCTCCSDTHNCTRQAGTVVKFMACCRNIDGSRTCRMMGKSELLSDSPMPVHANSGTVPQLLPDPSRLKNHPLLCSRKAMPQPADRGSLWRVTADTSCVFCGAAISSNPMHIHGDKFSLASHH
jgi:hypothetical protein